MLDASTDFALVSDARRINNLATVLSTDFDRQNNVVPTKNSRKQVIKVEN